MTRIGAAGAAAGALAPIHMHFEFAIKEQNGWRCRRGSYMEVMHVTNKRRPTEQGSLRGPLRR